MNFSKIISILFISFIALSVTGCSPDTDAQEDQKTALDYRSETGTEAEKSVPVEAMVLRKRSLEQKVILTGSLQAIHEIDLVSEVSGKVRSIFKRLGNRVSTSDTLAIIDDKIPYSQYRQALSQVINMENNLKIAQLNLKSDKELFANNDISKLEYENSVLSVTTAEANLLSAKANLSLMEKSYKDTRIMSPIAGLVARDYIELGMMINPNMPLYHIVDLHKLKVSVGIPQDLIQNITIGTRARITISALANKEFDGEVKFVSPQADATTGAFNIEIHLDNTPDRIIRAGMTARIELILDQKEKQLAIPDYAHIAQDGTDAVYKVEGDHAKLINVTLGENYGSNQVVTDGLAEGDTIVVVGMKNLGNNTKIWIETLH